ncbi:MAG: hypothetical protein A3F84_19845 [Candidatus Handelsmanbacteria bacterium RIFCSPLOWO2_12_FULL_64_10]|uniref:DUF1800 domain-containing protein n=1 Tax=Handelsmanbacteria sp. (strain RIFCSPLOWO2_12_FULL_64_10) TaxID=1817868 RepID=A0A1F6CSE8_HANXR|nr:MAG: hypothetical protein A3F84_19845 [Candidatus Handelsmanbacteria bacterium RIFCSPLOWO2_12_FULL_64_10]
MRRGIPCSFGFAAVPAIAALAAVGWVAIPAVAEVRPPLTEEQKIIHLLGRIGYGPRPGDVERVRRMGVDRYIERQLHPERIDDSATEARLTGLPSLRMGVAEVYERYPQPNQVAQRLGLRRRGAGADSAGEDEREVRRQVRAYYEEHGLLAPQRLLQELQAQRLIRAAHSERQLQEVMTDFWFNHFNVFWGKGADRWLTTDFEMNAVRPHALGRFRDLLLATARGPAMLFYLDNHLSASPDAKRPRRRVGAGMDAGQRRTQANSQRNRRPGINENYARELMELHTLGVDGGYTQKDVQEVARCFTGWTIENPYRGDRPAMEGEGRRGGKARKVGAFTFREWMHDEGEKTVLGRRIPAGGGIRDGERVIEILDPGAARFIATKLVRRFVSDDPPKSLVDRVAAVYEKTDGDIRKMLKAILTSPEFYAPEAYRAKVKSPFELAVSAVRALGGETDGSPRLAQFIARMGQPLYQCQPPTGYPDRAGQWVNVGTLLERLNFGLALCANRLPGTTVDLRPAGADSAQGLMDRAVAALIGGGISPQAREVLEQQMKAGGRDALDDGSAVAMSQGHAGEEGEQFGTQELRKRPQGHAGEEGDLNRRPVAEDLAMEGGDGMMNSDEERMQDRAARRGWMRGWGGARQAAASPPTDPEAARVFGLALGLPEFQRR